MRSILKISSDNMPPSERKGALSEIFNYPRKLSKLLTGKTLKEITSNNYF